MNYILNIETSTTNCSVSLFKDSELVSYKQENDENYSHSKRLHVFINDLLADSKVSPKDLSAVSESLSKSDLDSIMLDLKSTISNFDSLLNNVDNGEGSIGKLMKDDRLYINLQRATKQLEELLVDMKLNPKRYVHFSLFGKKVQQDNVDDNKVKTPKD